MNDTKQHDDGGPAFPVAGHTGENPELTAYGKLGHPGMSLRDWFAGMALQGYLGSYPEGQIESPIELIAIDAYSAADAMLAARKEAP